MKRLLAAIIVLTLLAGCATTGLPPVTMSDITIRQATNEKMTFFLILPP
jgi:outer membrane biogenesis lipoprotein LolB